MSEYESYVERQVDDAIQRAVKDTELLREATMQAIASCDSPEQIGHGVYNVIREAMYRLMHVANHPECSARMEHLTKSVLIMEHVLSPVMLCMTQHRGRENFTRFKEALIARVLGVFDDHLNNMRSATFRQGVINSAIAGAQVSDAVIDSFKQEDDGGTKITVH